jgi:hypothetical protein
MDTAPGMAAPSLLPRLNFGPGAGSLTKISKSIAGQDHLKLMPGSPQAFSLIAFLALNVWIGNRGNIFLYLFQTDRRDGSTLIVGSFERNHQK